MLHSRTGATAVNGFNVMNFQGKVVNADGTNVTNGTYTFDFVLYDDDTLGSPSDGVHDKWHELSKNVTVTNGVFQTELGSATSLPDFGANQALYLAVKFNGDAAGYMSPRIHMDGVPYAKNAAALATARSIGGVSFDGTTDITVASATGGFSVSGGNFTVTRQGSNALAVGRQGATSPALLVDTSNASSVTGLKILSGANSGGLALSTVGGASNENLTIDAKGTGTLTLQSSATGDIQFFGSTYKITSGGALTVASCTGCGSGSVGADSLDFTELKDALTLDAATTIGFGGNVTNYGLTFNDDGNGNFTIDLKHGGTGTGDFIVSSNGTAALTVNDNGTVDVGNAGGSGAITIDTGGSGGVTITGAAASNFTTSSGALTFTSAAAATWSTTAGTLTVQGGGGTVSLGSSTTLTATGALTVQSGGSSGLTINSASGRVSISTSDFLSTSVSGTSGSAAGDIWYNSADSNYYVNEGGTNKILCNQTDGCAVKTSTFTANNSFSIDSTIQNIFIEAVGGGGGGGGGAGGTGTTTRSGGGGGGGGAYVSKTFIASDLASTIYAVPAGATSNAGGGTAGAGTIGSNGGITCVSSTSGSCTASSTNDLYMKAFGGGGGFNGAAAGGGGGGGAGTGAGGTQAPSATGGAGGGAGPTATGGAAAGANPTVDGAGAGGATAAATAAAGGWTNYGGGGGGASTTAGANNSGAGGGSYWGGAGGGGGASCPATTPVARTGGDGGAAYSNTTAGGGTGGAGTITLNATGTAGGSGNAVGGGDGGGGGGNSCSTTAASTQTGGKGGDANYGGGGGGGGAAYGVTAATGGAGGKGGPGIVKIMAVRGANADLAEIYGTKDSDLQIGEILCLDPLMKAGVKLCQGPSDPTLMGAYSTAPAEVIGRVEDSDSRKPIPVALVGRVPVKVYCENGPIKAGDYITSSSQAGVGMKATKAGPVIGMAITDYTSCNSWGNGVVMVYVHNGYYNGSKIEDQLPTNQSDQDGQLNDRILDYLGSQVDNTGNLSVNLSEVNADRLTGMTVIAPTVLTKNLSLDQVKAATGQDITFNNDVVIKGTITADKIKANQIDGLELFIDKISTHQSTDGATAVATTSSPTTPGLSDSLPKNISMDSLQVVNLVTLAQIESKGGLVVDKDAQFNGKTIFALLAQFNGPAEFNDQVAFNSDHGGQVLIKKDAKKVSVVFTKTFNPVPIVMANWYLADTKDAAGNIIDSAEAKQQRLSDGGYRYVVANVTDKGFDIILNKPASEDLALSWLATAIKDARLSTSQNANN